MYINQKFLLAILKVSGSLEKSTEVMKSMQNLVKLPEISKTMQDLSKEMMKVSWYLFYNNFVSKILSVLTIFNNEYLIFCKVLQLFY